jgi:HEPN domain-containing protein
LAKRNRQKHNIDPSKIFVQAHRFFRATKMLYEKAKDDPLGPDELVLPAATLSAFTCELFLKCLICIESGDVPRGHNLQALFEKLSVSTKARVEEMWDEYAKHMAPSWDQGELDMGLKIARDLPSAISAGSRAFELIRYRHEDHPDDFQYNLDVLPHMLGCIAFELRPDWKEIRDQRIKTPSENNALS